MTQGESARFVESLLLRDVGEINDVEVVIIPPFTAIAKVTEALGRRAEHQGRRAKYVLGEERRRLPARSALRFCATCLCITSCSATANAARCLVRPTKWSIAKCARRTRRHCVRLFASEKRSSSATKATWKKYLSIQLRGSLAGLSPKELQETVIAYEPVWAIGTGRNATPAASAGSARVHSPHLARNDR